MEIKKSTLYMIGVIILIVLSGNFLLSNSKENLNPTNNVIQGNGDSNSDFQEVVIGMKNYNYYPNTISVKEGKPVRISLDNTVGGCFRDFTIRELGIHKYLQTSQDYIEFTPKKGTYRFACSMGMGTGTLIVE